MKNKFPALKTIAIALGAFFVLTAESCDNPPDSRQVEAARQEKVNAEANASVGMPAILNFTEKRRYKEIFEKRDDPKLQTYTYLSGIDGSHKPLCRSVGYGIPESEQYTNPMMIAYASTNVGVGIVPQADPNALFSSSSANGTWVLCLYKDGSVEPVRSEPNVITLTHPWGMLNQDNM
jgi:hypothetical protein